MLHKKVESTKWSAPFAKKREEINNGDIVTITDVAEEGADRYNPGKMQTAIRVKIDRVGERLLSLNQTSINILIDEFGSEDDTRWMGKKAKVLLKPTVIGGKKTLVLYLVGLGYELDEWGNPVDPSQDGVQKDPGDDIPVVGEEKDEDEINPEDGPF